jgi:YVTN family beta-propeller protein
MAEIPSGAVTFLFTDIEGSTRLVKQLREGYAEVVAEHQRLLRAAFAAHGGYEVDTQGDSFFVAFSSARDALLAAVEGQLALLSHPWPEGVAVKVRMGLHTGQAVTAHGRYTGLAVNRAARIGAAGHGGQVLVSQTTQSLLEDEEEDLHVFLRDLGEQRLKDLDRPVRLYQAAADGLPETFPPLRPAAELAQAAEAAIRPPLWRRPAVLGAAGIALTALVAALAFLATRDSDGGLSGIKPNHVGLIDPATNEIVAEVPVGIRPGPVAFGAGSIWVGNLQDRTLSRIDPRERATAATIGLENRTPTGIAVAQGAVWIAHGLLGSLSRVDPQFNQVTDKLEIAGRSSEGSVAFGSGAVWAAYGDSTFARIDPAATRVTGSTFAGAAPAGVVVATGAVWVANSGDATVFRYNPTTFEQGPIRSFSVGRRPTGIAFGHGAIWVANAGDDAVTRIDPSSNSTITITVGDGPTAVATSSDAVWVANTAGGTVDRIDPATNEVVATIEVRSAPAGLALGDGFIWVTAQAP